MASFTKFVPISKVDKEKRLVSGYASTPSLDSDDEVVDLEAIKNALPGYLAWSNIRMMHQPVAAGVAKEANVDSRGLFLTAKVTNDDVWKLVDSGPPDHEQTLKGFSIGGNVLKKVGNRIVEMELLEISLVDRPANPDCRFEIVKAAKTTAKDGIELQAVTVEDAPLSPGEVSFFRKFIRFIKGEHPLNVEEFGTVSDANTADTVPGDPKNPDHSHLYEKHLEPMVAGADIKPYGDVEYADPGHQSDGQHRYPVDTPEHIRAAWSYIHMPKNADKYSAEQLASIKSKIESAWKSKIDDKGPPGASEKFATGNQLTTGAGRVTTNKGMGEASQLSYAFETLRGVQRALLQESEIEEDPVDKEFSQRTGALATSLAGLIADLATHEGKEATNLTDEEDVQFRQWTGASLAMSIMQNMSKRFSAAFKEHMGKCAGHLAKAVGCQNDAMEGLRALREMYSKAAKAAKAGGGEAEKIDHEMAMEHIHKCMGAMTKMEDHHELASSHLEKCVKAAGATDAESRDMGEGITAPGWEGISGTGNPTGEGNTSGEEGIYAHLGAKGITPEMVKGGISLPMLNIMLDNAILKAQVEAMGRAPAGPFRAKTFDFGGAASETGDPTLAPIFKGVNLTPRDEMEANAAAATAVGNILQGGGKSIMDPSFKGAAGR